MNQCRTKDTNFSQTKPKPSNISKNTSQKRPETFVNLIDTRNMCDVAEEVIQVDANFESYHDNENIDSTEADSTIYLFFSRQPESSASFSKFHYGFACQSCFFEHQSV